MKLALSLVVPHQKKLDHLGHNCFEISKLTKFNEVLDGRVKTFIQIFISPYYTIETIMIIKRLFKKTDFPKIDFVIVNLYPFSKYKIRKHYNAIEMIDIGGPTLLRAAAKNFDSVTTIISPTDYALLVNNIKRNSGHN